MVAPLVVLAMRAVGLELVSRQESVAQLALLKVRRATCNMQADSHH